jgi:hypothetical protein
VSTEQHPSNQHSVDWLTVGFLGSFGGFALENLAFEAGLGTPLRVAAGLIGALAVGRFVARHEAGQE